MSEQVKYLILHRQIMEAMEKGAKDGIVGIRATSVELWELISKSINKLDTTAEQKASLVRLIGLYRVMLEDTLEQLENCSAAFKQEAVNSFSGLPLEGQKELIERFLRRFS